jgi:AraC family transcriptional regulator of adaptative response / DNA-3-methyladenine glycosylase II
VFPSAEVLREVTIDGMPSSRAETIRRIAHGSLDVKGIGPWTRSYIAMRSGDPDAFPETDLVLRKAMDDIGKRAEAWRPWRAYAAILLWRNS